GDVHIRAAFREFDKDGSGGIDREEVVEALNQLGLKTNRAWVVSDHQPLSEMKRGCGSMKGCSSPFFLGFTLWQKPSETLPHSLFHQWR
ncbi:MAG: EF-hand domain-containing protein, partial [Alphaproteobacteria bacterium]